MFVFLERAHLMNNLKSYGGLIIWIVLIFASLWRQKKFINCMKEIIKCCWNKLIYEIKLLVFFVPLSFSLYSLYPFLCKSWAAFLILKLIRYWLFFFFKERLLLRSSKTTRQSIWNYSSRILTISFYCLNLF